MLLSTDALTENICGMKRQKNGLARIFGLLLGEKGLYQKLRLSDERLRFRPNGRRIVTRGLCRDESRR